MTAANVCLLHGREVTQNRQSGLFFQNRRQVGVKRGPTSSKNQPTNLRIRPKGQKSPDLSGQSQAASPRPDGQNHRQIGCPRHLPGTGPVCAVHTVIESHGALYHNIVPFLFQQGPPHPVFPLKKKV